MQTTPSNPMSRDELKTCLVQERGLKSRADQHEQDTARSKSVSSKKRCKAEWSNHERARVTRLVEPLFKLTLFGLRQEAVQFRPCRRPSTATGQSTFT